MSGVQPIVLRYGQPAAVESGALRPAVFLDRDGVLNLDHGFVNRLEDWQWVSGAREALRRFNEAGYLVVVVTNQSGIGRGMFTERDFSALMDAVEAQLEAAGAHLDAVYACPHHPEADVAEYRVACDCRKPSSGLIQAAIADLGIDRERSVMIGDSQRDLDAAAGAGVQGLIFSEGDDLLRFAEENVPAL